MSTFDETGGSPPLGAPLGEILIEHQVITPEQLAIALADQQVSGDHLGTILVALGFVAPTTIAAALATQHGGLVKTEYGFATGLPPAPEPPPRPAPPAASEVSGLRRSFPLGDAPPPAAAQPDTVADLAASMLAEEQRQVELARERADLDAAATAASAEIERLAAENARLAAQLADDRGVWGAETGRLAAGNRTLELQLSELARERNELAAAASAETERLAAENRTLAAQLAELTAGRVDAAAPEPGTEGLPARLAGLELLLARVTNRAATISERLDEAIGDVARLHERLGADETAPLTRFPDALDRATADRMRDPDAA